MGVIDKLKNMMSGEIDDDEYMEYEDEVQEEDSLDIGETINSAARNPPSADKAVYRNRPAVCAGASGEV